MAPLSTDHLILLGFIAFTWLLFSFEFYIETRQIKQLRRRDGPPSVLLSQAEEIDRLNERDDERDSEGDSDEGDTEDDEQEGEAANNSFREQLVSKYEKSQKYGHEKAVFGLIRATWGQVESTLMLLVSSSLSLNHFYSYLSFLPSRLFFFFPSSVLSPSYLSFLFKCLSLSLCLTTCLSPLKAGLFPFSVGLRRSSMSEQSFESLSALIWLPRG